MTLVLLVAWIDYMAVGTPSVGDVMKGQKCPPSNATLTETQERGSCECQQEGPMFRNLEWGEGEPSPPQGDFRCSQDTSHITKSPCSGTWHSYS